MDINQQAMQGLRTDYFEPTFGLTPNFFHITP